MTRASPSRLSYDGWISHCGVPTGLAPAAFRLFQERHHRRGSIPVTCRSAQHCDALVIRWPTSRCGRHEFHVPASSIVRIHKSQWGGLT